MIMTLVIETSSHTMVRTRTSVYMSVLTTNYHLYIDGQSKEIIHIRQVAVNKANVCMYITLYVRSIFMLVTPHWEVLRS